MVALDRTDLIALGLSFGVPLVLVVIFGGVIVFLVRKPSLAPLMGADGVYRISGQLTPAHRWLALSRETFGNLEVTPHELIWRSLTGQEWRLPIRALVVRGPGGLRARSGVVIEGPGTGLWWLQVSDGPISPLAGDIGRKRRRERGNELWYLLLSRGAIPAAPV